MAVRADAPSVGQIRLVIKQNLGYVAFSYEAGIVWVLMTGQSSTFSSW